MVVHCAGGHDLTTALFEDLAAWRSWITLEVVQPKDLSQVCEVILRRFSGGVLTQMLESRGRSTVIEGSVTVRNDQQDVSPRPHHALPLGQRSQWVCEMLEHVGRKHRVVGVVRHVKVAGLANESPAY